MKRNLLLILILIISQNIIVFGQETKNYLTIGGSLAHLTNIEEANADFTPYPGYFKSPTKLGIELLYSRKLKLKNFIGFGMNFQDGRISSSVDGGSQYRFNFNELSLPIYFKRNFGIYNKVLWFCTSGFDFGKLIKVKAEGLSSWGWEKKFLKYVAYYSNDNFFTDLYFDFGLTWLMEKNSEICISPFFKYRLNSTWLNNHYKNFNFGLKICLTLKH